MKKNGNFAFDISYNCKKCDHGWMVRCPRTSDYSFIPAEKCHACYIDAMALNNKNHVGHNCREGFFYRNQRAEGNLL